MISGLLTGLRAISLNDIPHLLEWRNYPEFRQFFREHRELAIEDQIRWYEETVQKNETVRMFAITELSTNELIGACGLCYIDFRNQSADFSIYIGKDKLYIDDNFAPDVASTLLQFGFEQLNLNRVWAEIYSIDDKKQEFFENIGFTIEGRHRQSRWVNNQWVDSLYYAMLKDEYGSNRS
jgi:RimJ/RimL family protein N-acetyltransferase